MLRRRKLRLTLFCAGRDDLQVWNSDTVGVERLQALVRGVGSYIHSNIQQTIRIVKERDYASPRLAQQFQSVVEQ